MDGNSDIINRDYLDGFAIEWRHIGGKTASTECRIFGRTLKTPVMAGGMAHYEKMHEGGAPLFASGVREANTAMWTGFCSDEDMDKILAAGAPGVRIIKPFLDRDRVLGAIAHDEKAGAAAFSMDIDHVFDKSGNVYKFFDQPLAPQTVESLKLYAKSTSLPFYVKGVLSVADALCCAKAGVAGIVLSHHQNMFPWSVPPLLALPDIRKAVGDTLSIVVDCGIETGYDAFKALALGADAVCTARALRTAFTQGGAEAVTAYLNKMTAELAACLARTCSPDIRHIDPGVLHRI